MNNNLRKNVITNSKILLVGRIFQMLLQLIMGLVIPKLVTPLKFGLWKSLMIIYQYATFSNLGTYAAITVQMPYLEGRNEFKEKEILKNNTFYFNIFISLILAFGLIISAYFVKGEYQSFYKKGFILFSILIFTSNISDFYLQLFRIEKNFSAIGFLTVLQLSLQLLLSLIFLLLFEDVLFLAIAIIFSNILLITASIIKSGLPTFINIRVKTMIKLIQFGAPLLLNGVLLEFLRGIDQLLIIAFLKPEHLGYYALAIAIQRIGFLIPGVLASTTMPYIYEEYGRSQNIINASRIYEKAIIIVSLLSSYLIVNMIIFSDILIKFYLPKYLDSLPVLIISLVGMFSISLLGLPEILASITNRINKMIKWQIFLIFYSTITIFIIIKMGYGILGVAFASSLNYLLFTLGILFITFKIYIDSNRIILIKILTLYLPYIYMLLICFVLNIFIKINIIDINFAIIKTFFKAFILLIFFIPIFYFYNRKFNFIKFKI
jgi:O-antigen/teichoic acid export membrane protein